RAGDLNRDQRREIRLLREIGWYLKRIKTYTGATMGQVRYAISAAQATPRKRSCRPGMSTAAQIDELIEFITSSKEGRRMPWKQLPEAMGWIVAHYAVRYALRRAG
ncbi:hypothetical protein N657DRAFT_552084, partial [Parathielavia appendiculata]